MDSNYEKECGCPAGSGGFQEGYCSVEEQAQDYIRLFLSLQQEPEGGALFPQGRKYIAERERRTGIFLPSLCLRERYDLTETQYWLVMLAFCCEVEEGLCLDFRKKRNEKQPDLQYALHLLSGVLPVSFSLISEMGRRGGVMEEILHFPEVRQAGLLSAPLLLEAGAFYFLLDGSLTETGAGKYFPPGDILLPSGRMPLPLHKEAYRRLRRWLTAEESCKLRLHGVRGCGKHTLLKRVCGECGSGMVFVRVSALAGEEEAERIRQLRALRLVCRLIRPVLVAELVEEGDASLAEEFFFTGICNQCKIVLLTEHEEEAAAAGRLADVRISLPQALSEEETGLVLDSLVECGERRNWQDELLRRYRFSVGELERKLRAIRFLAEEKEMSLGDREPWAAGMREHGMSSRLVRIIESRYTLEDIVLPGDCREQLEVVTGLAKGWNGGQGLHLLFHGSSGTGKTMAASALAGELLLPLFKVDLSQVFDKYIGETEKHLEEIFRAAERERGLLFFDEADALFGKRTGIQDSHDRYANVSTAYLLQRIEEYDGIVILATNLLDHFDDAFVRRIRFVIRFRNPDREDRERMWVKVLERMHTAGDISPSEFARAAELSPARIKAAAGVAELLAGCGGTVTREHIRKALELEAGKDQTTLRGLS